MAAAEQFLENPVKLIADFSEFFLKLPAHTGIQLLNDLQKRLLCLYQIIMLGLHKFIPLGNLLKILNGIYIYISQCPDPVLQLLNPAPKLRNHGPLRIPQCLCSGKGQLILAPHVIHMAFQLFLQLFLLALETEQILVQAACPRG